MKGGAVVTIIGVWMLCQILGGDALERLKILPDSGKAKPPPITSTEKGTLT